ncbi:hypothetical protein AKJ65_04085 [candidate division MSBL1 archaeon SCGC-AAA259E19]|uniref:Uncharacterized protein n=2 Tax=candidate division MSBL1 TaxID=215777 RepID=A0A133UH49_9EURY|nr:hypothetical protein AKJ64_00470 [candidate division MSBL1 archaeon SCGC-AAA259E17]KXA94539.1 hypothetical protein AKJ65_04085 [candidate division MSBL1 archaeon SCGC-AAA259E19]
MSGQTGRGLPSGIVKFTITRGELRDILSEKYNEDVEAFSLEEEGISISLRLPEKEETKEEFEEEPEEEGELGEEESDFSDF